jgi:hypothetical protein
MPKTEWTVQNIDDAKYLGALEFQNEQDQEWIYFDVLLTKDRKTLVFGGSTNHCFLQSGYLTLEEDQTVEEGLQELFNELEVYYRARIVCNERM